METVSVNTSISNSVCNIYIHGHAFKQKLLLCKSKIKKGRLSKIDKNVLSNF